MIRPKMDAKMGLSVSEVVAVTAISIPNLKRYRYIELGGSLRSARLNATCCL